MPMTKKILIASILLCAAPAFAQQEEAPQSSPASSGEVSDEAYDEIVAQAEVLFQQRDYDGAIRLLDEAFAIRKNSNILYNIARIYEEKGDLNGALAYYDRFIVAPNVDLNYRREALERSKTIREILDATKTETEPTPEEPVVVAKPVESQPAPKAQASSSTNTLGVVLAVVGGATMLGGGAFGILAIQEDDARKNASNITEARQAGDNADLYAGLADGMLIGGALVGITGLVLILTGDSDESTTTSLAPVVLPQGAGAAWTVKF